MISAVIQAGGESRRMGRNKAMMLFGGDPLILRVLKRLSGFAEEIIVVTNSPECYDFLRVRLVRDIVEGAGVLGGLYTALQVVSEPFVVVVGCDMPFISVPLFQVEKSILLKDEADVVIPTSPNGIEPLHAIYRREACLPVVKKALERGDKRMISWFPEVKVRIMTLDEVFQADPDSHFYLNINTVADFKAAEDLERIGCR